MQAPNGLLERKVANAEWALAVRMGLVPGWSANRKFGYNVAVSTNWEALWSRSTAYTFPSVPDVLSVISGATADAAAGTGVRSVLVQGLGSNWEYAQETITMNGTAGATGTTQFTRVNRVSGLVQGTYTDTASNVGAISVVHATSTATLAYIPAGEGVTQQLVYSVPANSTAFFGEFVFTEDSNKAVSFRGRYRQNINNTLTPSPWYNVGQAFGLSAYAEFPVGVYIPLPGPADFLIQAQVAAQTGSANGYFGYYEVKDGNGTV